LNINSYIAEIESIIHSFSIVANYNLNIDRKTEDIAFLSGKIFFRDGSVLDFKKFLESTETGFNKYKYGYNYRIDSLVLFRYDNASDPKARRLTSFPHHKHTKNGAIIESKQMQLSEVFEEIENIILSNLEI